MCSILALSARMAAHRGLCQMVFQSSVRMLPSPSPESQLWQAAALAVAGFLVIYLIERIGRRLARKTSATEA